MFSTEIIQDEAGAGLANNLPETDDIVSTVFEDIPEMVIEVDPANCLLDLSNNDCKFSIIEKYISNL